MTLADTFNKTNNRLEIDPTESQLGGGSFTTTGPGGSYQLDLIFDVFAKAFGGPLHVTVAKNIDVTLLKKNSSTLNGSFDLPDGLGTVAFQWPQVNTTGSNPNPGTISSTGHSQPIFQLNIDPIAVVLDAILGNDPLKGTVGNLPPLQIKYTILAATLAPGVDVQQSFNLNPGNLTGTLTNGKGSTIPFSFGTPTFLDNPLEHGFQPGPGSKRDARERHEPCRSAQSRIEGAEGVDNCRRSPSHHECVRGSPVPPHAYLRACSIRHSLYEYLPGCVPAADRFLQCCLR